MKNPNIHSICNRKKKLPFGNTFHMQSVCINFSILRLTRKGLIDQAQCKPVILAVVAAVTFIIQKPFKAISYVFQ